MSLTKVLKRLIKDEVKKYQTGESHHGSGGMGNKERQSLAYQSEQAHTMSASARAASTRANMTNNMHAHEAAARAHEAAATLHTRAKNPGMAATHQAMAQTHRAAARTLKG